MTSEHAIVTLHTALPYLLSAYAVIETPVYAGKAERILTDEEREGLAVFIEQNPKAGSVVRGRRLIVTRKKKMSAEGAELLKAVKQMKAKKKGKVYRPEQLLAIAARQSVNLTQKKFAQLLNVSIDSVQDWEQ